MSLVGVTLIGLLCSQVGSLTKQQLFTISRPGAGMRGSLEPSMLMDSRLKWPGGAVILSEHMVAF